MLSTPSLLSRASHSAHSLVLLTLWPPLPYFRFHFSDSLIWISLLLSLTWLGLLLGLYAYIYEKLKLGQVLMHKSLVLWFLARDLFCKFLIHFAGTGRGPNPEHVGVRGVDPQRCSLDCPNNHHCGEWRLWGGGQLHGISSWRWHWKVIGIIGPELET